MEEYIRDKVFTYCNQRKENDENFSGYDVSEDLKSEWWRIVMVCYGQWIHEISDATETVEFSQQEW